MCYGCFTYVTPLDVSGCCTCILEAVYKPKYTILKNKEQASRIQYVIVLEIPKRLADL